MEIIDEQVLDCSIVVCVTGMQGFIQRRDMHVCVTGTVE